MPDSKEYICLKEENGNIQISDEVIANLATETTLEVEGIAGLMNNNVSDIVGGKKMTAKGVKIEVTDDSLVINLFVIVDYGTEIASVAKNVQSSVYGVIENLGLTVSAVNVHVGGINFNN